MKKFLSIFVFLFSIKMAVSLDNPIPLNNFEVNSGANSIIGNLWHGYEISQDDLEDFFELIEKQYNLKNTEESNKAVLVNEWKNSMIDFLKYTNSNEQISTIEKFADQVDTLKDNFSAASIGMGLGIITDKF